MSDTDTPLESQELDLITESLKEKVGLTDSSDSAPTTADSLEEVADYPRLKGYFGIANATPEDKAALKQIWSYFQKDAKTLGEVVAGIRQLENKLASPPLGQGRLQHLAAYLRVMRDIEDVKTEARGYEK